MERKTGVREGKLSGLSPKGALQSITESTDISPSLVTFGVIKKYEPRAFCEQPFRSVLFQTVTCVYHTLDQHISSVFSDDEIVRRAFLCFMQASHFYDH